jgi:hypothetical protein
MNKYLILSVALNELNHISSGNKYYLAMENDPARNVIFLENKKENLMGAICYLDQIESFTVGDVYILLNEKDGSVMKLDENDADWIEVGEKVI